VVLKTPAADLQADPELLERFMLEEWIARRLSSPHVLKPYPRTRERRFLYVAMEYVEGRPSQQWMTDNPRPDSRTVRGIVEQIAAACRPSIAWRCCTRTCAPRTS
jgi:serine/threonine protein kinase